MAEMLVSRSDVRDALEVLGPPGDRFEARVFAVATAYVEGQLILRVEIADAIDRRDPQEQE